MKNKNNKNKSNKNKSKAEIEAERDYQHKYREEHKSYYIYMFVKPGEEEQQEVYYIGSTFNIKQRISYHLGRHSDLLSRIEANKIKEYDIIYAEIDQLKELDQKQGRAELYYIEYYLIHKYFLANGNIPICNIMDTINTNITPGRQIELILIAENLKFNCL